MQVNFLRKAEYLAAASDIKVYGGGADNVAVREREQAKKKQKLQKDKEGVVAAVEKTFKAAKSASVFFFRLIILTVPLFLS